MTTLILAFALVTSPWIFLPSTHSHQRPAKPKSTPQQGTSVTTGYRRIQSQVNVGGQINDQLNLIETWNQPRH